MSNNEKIGLVVWGCKGGYRVFCSKGVDVKKKEISDTIKDIRSYLRFNLVNLTTYAVEFTEEYKVFTVYRSCNDSGSGGYVAITVYVPHELRVKNLRARLDDEMNKYFKEFVHPVFGTYLDGTYDSIDQYESFLSGLEVEEDRLYYYKASKQDDRPHLVVYESEGDLDKYIDEPYRKEFYDCQEVMFMSCELYNRGSEALNFNLEENRIKNISEQEEPPSLKVGNTDGVKLLEINGVKKKVPGEYEVVKGIEVRIVLTKQHYEDYEAKGTVSSLMHEGILVEKDKEIRVCWSSKINFKPKTYQIDFTLDGKSLPDDLVYIESKNGQINVKGGKLSISGEEVTNSYDMYFRPSSTISGCSIYLCKFLPKDYISENTIKSLDLGQRNVGLQKVEIKVKVDSGVKKSDTEIKVCVGNNKIESVSIPISSIRRAEKLELYIKKDIKLSSSSFESSDKDVEVKFENNTLTVSPLCLEYELGIPSEVKNLVGHWDFTIGGKSKKNEGCSRSWKVKIEPADDINKGTLTINGSKYEYEIKGNKIIPRMVLIKIKCGGCECEATWLTQDKESKSKFDSNTILPYKKEDKDKLRLSISDNSYTQRESPTSLPIVIIEVMKKSGSNSGGQGGTNNKFNQPTPEPKHPNDDKKISIRTEGGEIKLKFVSGFGQEGENKYYITNTRGEKKYVYDDRADFDFSSDDKVLYDKDGNEVCKIYKNEQDYQVDERRENEEKGIYISYPSNNTDIEKRKSYFTKKNVLRALCVAAGIVLLGVIALFVWHSGKVQGLTVKFEIQDNPYDEKIVCVHFKDYASGNDYIKLDKDSLAIYVDKDFSAKYSELKNIINQPLIFKFDSDEDVDTVLYNWDEFSKVIESYQKAEKEQVSKKTLTLKITETPLTKKMKEVKKRVSEIGTDNDKLLQYYDSLIQQLDNEQFKKEINVWKNQVAQEKSKQDELNRIVQEGENNKEKLWNLNCNLATVQNVSQWWNGLDKSQQETVKSRTGYDFTTAIYIYGEFFRANSINDITQKICEKNRKGNHIYKGYFSVAQWKAIVEGYGIGTDKFKQLKESCGMSFSKPYSLGLIN